MLHDPKGEGVRYKVGLSRVSSLASRACRGMSRDAAKSDNETELDFGKDALNPTYENWNPLAGYNTNSTDRRICNISREFKWQILIFFPTSTSSL